MGGSVQRDRTVSAEVIHGDCLDVMRSMPDASVDAVVTDPPYGLSFMGKDWDHGVPGVPFWAEALRVAKPGTRLLAFGGTRTFHRLAVAIEDAGWRIDDCLSWLYGSGFPKHASKLKPAWEPVIMARKPDKKATALNIDACKIGAGRWPANVVLDEEAAAGLDEHSGELKAGVAVRHRSGGRTFGTEKAKPPMDDLGYGDSGGASRFFYCAKASRSERDAGLDGMPEKDYAVAVIQTPGVGHHGQTINGKQVSRARNFHPTVKPVALMQWLVRLVTPSGGMVLDPFCGSGTTGVAAVREGRSFAGIEKDAAYVEIASKRIRAAETQLPLELLSTA